MLRISAEAEAELAEASRWYEERRPGLGLDFLDAVDEAIAGIADMPNMGSAAPGVADAAIRRSPVRRFPFHLIYIELTDRIQILAVAHDRRRPGYWAGRVPR